MQQNSKNTNNNRKKPRRKRRRRSKNTNNNNDTISENTNNNNDKISENTNIIMTNSCCYVTGIPKDICTEQLFRQYGKIKKIIIDDNYVAIIYFDSKCATTAINDINIKYINLNYKANDGTKIYCKYFLQSRKCPDVDCDYKHDWSIATKQEIFSSISNSSNSNSSNSNSSNSNISFSCKFFQNKNNSTSVNVNVHQNMSKAELEQIRIREKKICFIRGLPDCLYDQKVLQSTFSQFGQCKIIINDYKKQAHIIYNNEHSAANAVQFAKACPKNLSANFGTKKYCETFLDGKLCGKLYCTYAHKWCAQDEIVSFDRQYKKTKYCIQSSIGTDIMKRLENENAELKIYCKQLEIKYAVLNDKHKQLQIKFNEINNCIKIDIYKYKTWDCQQVYQWIIWDGNCNGYFKQFATKLFYNNLKKENINGWCLERLHEDDVYRLGITDFRAKKLLIKYIKELIAKASTTNNGEEMA